MTKISRTPLIPKKMAELYDNLWETIANLKSKEEVESFFHDLLTHTEQKMLAKRLQIALRLIEGKDYQEIRDELKVSSPTISTVNNWLNTGAVMLEKSIRRTLTSRKEEAQAEIRNFSHRRYMSGDLLLPAVDAVGELIKTAIKKKSR